MLWELVDVPADILTRWMEYLPHSKFEAVEWNLAWFICFYARLADAEQAHENVVALLSIVRKITVCCWVLRCNSILEVVHRT